MHAAIAEMTSNQNEGTVLQCGLLALSMARACNSEAISCAVWPVIIPRGPLSPLRTARSSASDMPFMSSMRSRTGIMCDMLYGLSMGARFGMVSSNAEGQQEAACGRSAGPECSAAG